MTQELIVVGSLIGNIEKALSNYRLFKKENKGKWASYWLGVIDTNIFMWQEMFGDRKSRIIEIAKKEIDYKRGNK